MRLVRIIHNYHKRYITIAYSTLFNKIDKKWRNYFRKPSYSLKLFLNIFQSTDQLLSILFHNCPNNIICEIISRKSFKKSYEAIVLNINFCFIFHIVDRNWRHVWIYNGVAHKVPQHGIFFLIYANPLNSRHLIHWFNFISLCRIFITKNSWIPIAFVWYHIIYKKWISN